MYHDSWGKRWIKTYVNIVAFVGLELALQASQVGLGGFEQDSLLVWWTIWNIFKERLRQNVIITLIVRRIAASGSLTIGN